jgi:hypothetical protein
MTGPLRKSLYPFESSVEQTPREKLKIGELSPMWQICLTCWLAFPTNRGVGWAIMSPVPYWLLAFACMFLALPAHAQAADDGTRARARDLGTSGVVAYQAGDFASAEDKLQEAYHLLRAPSLGLWSARALVARGKLVAAAERYLEVKGLPVAGGKAAVQHQAQADAERELSGLKAKIPTIRIEIQGASAAEVLVTLDGVPLGLAESENRPVDPGSHRLEGRYGGEIVRVAFEIAEAAHQPVQLKFVNGRAIADARPIGQQGPRVPAQSPNSVRGSSRTLGWIAVGVGGVGVGLWVVAGSMAIAKKSNLDASDECWQGSSRLQCTRAEPDVSTYKSLRTLATVGFVAGSVLVATGLALVLTSSDKNGNASSAQTHVALRLGIVRGGGALMGTF